VVYHIKNTEEILMTIGHWLESNPISTTFSSHDRIMGFSALDTLRYASFSQAEVQSAVEQLENLLNTANPATNPPHQTLLVLRALITHHENKH
jgi:hypothetical protein